MKPVYIFFIFIFVFGKHHAQDQAFTIFDTLALSEVSIVKTVPLSDATILSIYQGSDFSSIDKINSRLGGVSLISRGAYALEPSLIGFSAGQINVTIDGMKMFGACTDRMDPITSYVEPVNLSGLQLSYGSNGSLNGSTVGGSYNMQLQSPILSKFKASAGIGFESVSSAKTAQFLLNYGKEKWAYRISGVSKNYLAYIDGNGQEVPFTQFSKLNLHQSFSLATGKTSQLKFDWLIDDATDVGYPALPMDVGKAEGRIYSIEFAEREKLWKIENFQAKLYANTVYHLMDDSKRDSLYLLENSADNVDSVYMKMDMPGWSNTYGGFITGSFSWLGKNNFSFKLENYYNWAKAEMTMYMNNLSYPGEPPMYAETWPENSRNVAGLFLQNSTIFSPKLKIDLNARLDYSSSNLLSDQGIRQFEILGHNAQNTYNKLVKSINLNIYYKLIKQLNLSGGVGVGERLPSLSEQFGFYLFNAKDGYDYIGNPELLPERSWSFWSKIAYGNKSIKLSWENYYNQLSDYIFGITKPDYQALNLYAAGVKQYENLERANLFSSNLKFLWEIKGGIAIFNLAKYNYGSINNSEAMPLIEPFKNISSVSYRPEQYYMQLEYIYSARQNRINSDYGEVESNSFGVFNLRLGYNFNILKSKLKLGASVENIFNEVYSEHLDWGVYNRPGRNILLNLQFVFEQ